MPISPFVSVQHIAFNCRDLPATEAFYTRHFGFRRVRVFHAGEPNEFVMLRLGQLCLELFGTTLQEGAGEQGVGFKHLAFEVEKLEPAMAALREDGVEAGRIIELPGIEPGFRICFFKDPDGNVLELMEGWRDQT